MSDKRTVMQVMEATAAKHGDKPALRHKQGDSWRTITWSEYRDNARAAAKSLIKLGLEPAHGVAIIGFNCPQWAIADIATIYAGGCPAGIYTTNSADQCQYIAAHSDAQVAVVENQEHLAKFKECRKDLPKLKAIVMMRGDDPDPDVYSWAQFLELGKSVTDAELQQRIDAQKPDDTATYIYTSGTTGDPKAVMITHDNLTWTASSSLDMLGTQEGDRVISYLPFSHIAEQIVSLHGPMAAGMCTAFAESMEKLGDNLREIRPTMFLGVPRVWEKIQSKMQAMGAKNTGLKKKISVWARGQGLAGGYADQKGEAKPLLYGLADKLVFSKVREALGLDQCRICVTSAAPISKSTLEYFLSLGVPIMEVYGMSECTGPATISLPHKYKTGSVGLIMDGTEIKIAPDGEICMRGRHVFKGYFKNPASTAETLDEEGWLHSGDIGEFDADGFLKITDRKKDLLITAGGENIAPQVLEGRLKAIGALSQAVVIGDRQKFLSALVTLDETKLEDTVRQAGSSAKTMGEAASDPKVHAWLMSQVEEINKTLARVQTIKKIKVLPAELSIEAGELTPTMKIKRKVVNTRYERDIAAFYEGAPD
ncbi:MAG: AMP-binding protein [Deltaproteobacteria bacterium]|nr:AMP-binding protein [Nannocystaceae bacterium]